MVIQRIRSSKASSKSKAHLFEALESRTLMSVGASAQLSLVSTDTTSATPVYHYDITLTNTGTTKIGTFWFAWLPGQDFLPTTPSAESSPTGWGNGNGASPTPALTGSGDSADGIGIQWVAQSPAALLSTGQSLGGFSFTSTDSPTTLAGSSPTHPTQQILTSVVYIGAPFSDPGDQFTVAAASATQLSPSQVALAPSESTINSGNSVTLTATVSSTPPGGAAPSGTVNFFSNGTSLGSIIVAGDGLAQLVTTALPAGTDSITATYSGDATFATSISPAISITVNQAAVISPAITKSTLPASGVVGTAVSGNVVVSLTNFSGAKTNSSATVDLYASTTGSIDSTAVIIGSAQAKIKLNASASQNVTIKVKSLTAALLTGNYQLFARVTNAGTATADSIPGPALALAPANISFTPTLSKQKFPKVIISGKKNKASAVVTVANSGNIATSGKATITFGVSANCVTIVSTFPPKSVPAVIKPSKSKSFKVGFTIDPALASGTYFLAATVALDGKTLTAMSTTTFTVT